MKRTMPSPNVVTIKKKSIPSKIMRLKIEAEQKRRQEEKALDEVQGFMSALKTQPMRNTRNT